MKMSYILRKQTIAVSHSYFKTLLL